MSEITLGRTVLYTLSAQDAVEINRRRTTCGEIAEKIKLQHGTDHMRWPLGAQAHIGNEAKKGQVFPMTVVKIHDDGVVQNTVNGQVFLDGNDVFWAQYVVCGDEPGMWQWPPRV